MNDSILTSVKKLLTGLTEDDTTFDMDIIIHINSALSILNQLGVGEPGFSISDKSATWTEFLGSDEHIDLVKTYVVLKVRQVFDPPSTGPIVEAYNKQLSELEWRINVAVDPKDDNVLAE